MNDVQTLYTEIYKTWLRNEVERFTDRCTALLDHLFSTGWKKGSKEISFKIWEAFIYNTYTSSSFKWNYKASIIQSKDLNYLILRHDTIAVYNRHKEREADPVE